MELVAIVCRVAKGFRFVRKDFANDRSYLLKPLVSKVQGSMSSSGRRDRSRGSLRGLPWANDIANPGRGRGLATVSPDEPLPVSLMVFDENERGVSDNTHVAYHTMASKCARTFPVHASESESYFGEQPYFPAPSTTKGDFWDPRSTTWTDINWPVVATPSSTACGNHANDATYTANHGTMAWASRLSRTSTW